LQSSAQLAYQMSLKKRYHRRAWLPLLHYAISASEWDKVRRIRPLLRRDARQPIDLI